eukprot:2700334-Amphidinium_carterae.1
MNAVIIFVERLCSKEGGTWSSVAKPHIEVSSAPSTAPTGALLATTEPVDGVISARSTTAGLTDGRRA